MKNTLISYANLEPAVKKAFKEWLEETDPDTLSFPFKGSIAKGYLFSFEETNYLVAMQSTTAAKVINSDDDDDDDDIEAEDVDLGADIADDVEEDEDEDEDVADDIDEEDDED